MSKVERPHLAWTAAVLGAVAALSGAAWWLWSRPGATPEAPPIATAPESAPPSTDPNAERADELRSVLDAASIHIENARFRAAAHALEAAEERFGWSEEIGATAARLALREASYREALRPIEFRIEALTAPSESTVELYARFSLEGVPVFATELLQASEEGRPLMGGLVPARSHLAVLRTSFAIGASLEIVEPGGIFDSEEVLFGPVPLSPLPITEGGQLDFVDPDARVRTLVVSYRPSPFEPGVHVDGVPPLPPPDATAAQLVDSITAALGRDALDTATVLQARLNSEFTDHPDASFFAERIEARREFLLQNRTTATFTILELSVDPRPSGDRETKLWASGGSAPDFHSSIRTTDDVVLASTGDDRTAPYLIPGSPEPPPPGNVLRVVARGAAPLLLVVKDSAPRFSSRVVGAVDLPVSLADLPRGTGTIVIERNPRVLIQPNSEPNRIRRVVLRWSVAR
ncbi:hypothetical protein Poly30_10930 [Planctomycetes bacterium Poly30]|uniref:Uncharacterized protein n=1 Tax=Saltatorellus ferox TaxID=2528018 RepID=A0A518END2_9BACT|nr:hypothetical protein Poly30_10930 [Planctomycetes bacterium Poly30]